MNTALASGPHYVRAFIVHPDVFNFDKNLALEFLIQLTEDRDLGVVSSFDWELIRPRRTVHGNFFLLEPFFSFDANSYVNFMEVAKYLLIRGIPASSKTILLHLIQKRLEKEGKVVVRYDSPWPTDPAARSQLHDKLAACRSYTLRTRTETGVSGIAPARHIDFLIHRREVENGQVSSLRSWGIKLGLSMRTRPPLHTEWSLPKYDFIILDFRTSRPTKPQPLILDLIHVVFSSDYTSVDILDNNRVEKMTFPLTRRLP
ncbi:hypothetical protein B0H19DRAFT_1077618 [Mycena capillaripes]|nr:hypothetical protein B0H19DRAFT_1077618 [Mycena capillaripes]